MNGTYNIILKSQLGPKSGTLFLKATRRRLWCCLSLLGNENILVGIHDKDTFNLKGKFTTALGPVKCQLSGRLLGPRNFDDIGINKDKTIEVFEATGASEVLDGIGGNDINKAIDSIGTREVNEPVDTKRDHDSLGAGDTSVAVGASENLDTSGHSKVGDIMGENLLEASIVIDGKEYQLNGTLA